MELVIICLLIAAVIYIIINYVIPTVVAAGKIVVAIVAGIAVIAGFISAVTNYFAAIKNNIDFRNWKWEKDDEPARRSYYFGPGYEQLGATIKNAFELNAASGAKISEDGSSFKGDSTGLWGLLKAIGGLIYTIVGCVCVYIFGTVLCCALAIIHGSITTVFMLLTYVVFTVVWIIDRIYLLVKKIRSDCPNCHSRFLVPYFMCPECGAIHKKLVPGIYGIWNHKCNCGKTLPCTFLNGRSKLESLCPDCNASLVASDARPVVFQLVGGTGAGKTVYLSAFFHEYLNKLSDNCNLKFTITDQYRPYFEELEEWYNGTRCPTTQQLNSQMYPLLIDSSLGVRRQFSIYDIAGEMFNGFAADAEIQQQQFHYCDRLMFLLDPFSSGYLRANKIRNGANMSDFSDMAAENVATNFINYLIRTGHAKANSRCSIPIAVLIAKSDITEVERELCPARIALDFWNNMDFYGTYDNARDSICRQFLVDNGLSATVENLETQFSNLHYFPVSAMGHSYDGTPYEPWGIMDAIEWMLPLADKELSDLITPPVVIS